MTEYVGVQQEDREERIEAADRASRYYEIQGRDEPDHNSEEWREMFNYYYDKVRDGE